MANVFTIGAPGTSFAIEKCLLGLFNGVGSGRVLRVYKVWILNNQTVAVTGGMVRIRVDRLTTGSGGLDVLPVKHDSSSPSLPSAVTCATNISFTRDVTLRRFMWSSDEPIATDAPTNDEMETLPFVGQVVDHTASYQWSTVEPYVLRPGYGLGVVCEGAYTGVTLGTPAGACDVFIEFTSETS